MGEDTKITLSMNDAKTLMTQILPAGGNSPVVHFAKDITFMRAFIYFADHLSTSIDLGLMEYCAKKQNILQKKKVSLLLQKEQ